MLLIKNARVYAPENLGQKDILVVGGVIYKIADHIDENAVSSLATKVVEAQGKILAPGFIDHHEHIMGAGGEAGYYSRTPEISVSGLVVNGITTVVGMRGTDGTSRHQESLFAKAMALETEGISTYITTGSYEVPVSTFTGSIRKDIYMIEKVIGTGEIAISDRRSSQPTRAEIERVAADSYVAGLISGKRGFVHFHMGDGERGLDMLLAIIAETEIPARQFIVTHVNRKRTLLDQSKEFAKVGGIIDFTAGISDEDGFPGAVKPSRCIAECMNEGVPLSNITMSSDANGSMALYENGVFIRLLVTKADTLLAEFRDLVFRENIPLETALAFITSNVANAIGLYPKKGAVTEGSHADFVLMTDDLKIDCVVAKGKIVLKDGTPLIRGTFE